MKRKIIKRETTFEDNSALKYLEDEKVLLDIDNDSHQHKHNDYQIVFVTKGKLKGFVGSNLGDYMCEDIVVIGKNVPHYFILDGKRSTETNDANEIEVLHFKHDLFPTKINEIAEFNFIQLLLKRSQQGLFFRDKTLFEKIRNMLYKIDDVNGIQKLIELYQILDTIGRNVNFNIISNEEYNSENSITTNVSSLQRTYNYLYAQFRNDITLAELSKYAHQNPTALCRTFKRETGKTIFQFLNKIRIENVCKLLLNTDMSISQIAYESGFPNLPHFNKQFKLITNKTPSDYRESIES